MDADTITTALDANGDVDFFRGERRVGGLIWGWNRTDKTRFGWLLHAYDGDGEEPAVFRVGDSGMQERLWECGEDTVVWRDRAETVRDVTRQEAVDESLRFLEDFAA